MELKEIKQVVALEEVSTTAEISKEVESQEESKGVGINKPEVLSFMKNNHHHGTIILHYLEDPFLQKKSAKDDSFKFFKFISPTISTWVQHVLQGMSNFISDRTLEDLLRGRETMSYGSVMYLYGWIIEEHQPIGIDYQPIRDDYIEDSMTQYYIEFDEESSRRIKILESHFSSSRD